MTIKELLEFKGNTVLEEVTIIDGVIYPHEDYFFVETLDGELIPCPENVEDTVADEQWDEEIYGDEEPWWYVSAEEMARDF